jgi:bifunctional DNA-binding transcriptional regulator/antitoxin component of YhaV-PrlF toxin-antitoxin module
MKKPFLRLFPLLVLVPLLFGCSVLEKFSKLSKDSDKPQIVQCSDRTCEVTIPPHWREGLGLNKDTVIDVFQPFENAFLIVMREDRAKSFVPGFYVDNYMDMTKAVISKNYRGMEWSQIDNTQINGADARLMIASGQDKDKRMKFVIAAVATNSDFFQIMAWCDEKDFAKNEADMLGAVRSFKATGLAGILPKKKEN